MVLIDSAQSTAEKVKSELGNMSELFLKCIELHKKTGDLKQHPDVVQGACPLLAGLFFFLSLKLSSIFISCFYISSSTFRFLLLLIVIMPFLLILSSDIYFCCSTITHTKPQKLFSDGFSVFGCCVKWFVIFRQDLSVVLEKRTQVYLVPLIF